MNVEPDFLSHWKTQMLVDLLGETAPFACIALWGHCQTRRAWIFPDMTPVKLKAICRWKGDAEALWKAMADSGYIDLEGTNRDTVRVHDWEVSNAGLVRAWSGGVTGGRPKKPSGDLPGTLDKPSGNLPGTLDKPSGNLPGTLDKPSGNLPGAYELNCMNGTKNPPLPPDGGDEHEAGESHEGEYSKAFLEFWAAYPEQKGKGAAWRAWKKLKLGSAALPDIIDGIERWRSSREWTEGFIAHPSTWLNQRRWEDDPLPVPKKFTAPAAPVGITPMG